MMSPTPPLPNQVNAVSDGTMKLQPNFINSGLNHSQQIANPQYSGMALCNGHTENMETQGMKGIFFTYKISLALLVADYLYCRSARSSTGNWLNFNGGLTSCSSKKQNICFSCMFTC